MSPRVRLHLFCGFALASLSLAATPAERAADIARIHVEAMGGASRVAALKAFSAQGSVVAGGETARFTLTAARPNRLRLEVRTPTRTLVQATDGAAPPWQSDSTQADGAPSPMPPDLAKTFLADAQFDDPLVTGNAPGNRIEFAGEADVEGRKLLRLLVTRDLNHAFHLLVDPQTYFIVMRVDRPVGADGRRGSIITSYGDFRPVAGVIVAHRIRVLVDGRLAQDAQLETIEANPRLPSDHFRAPTSRR